MSEKPNRFQNLHSHTNSSIGDGLGYPKDHIDYVISNGGNGMAITDHGNMISFSHAYLYNKKLKEKGINFKYCPGVEAYYVPSLKEWAELKASSKDKPKGEIIAPELKAGDPFAPIVQELELARLEDAPDDAGVGGTSVENEEESKSVKQANPLRKRYHLVVLAKNNQGLKSLFKMVSRSVIDGYYYYPRIDLDMIREYSKGNLIGSSACIAGKLSGLVLKHYNNPTSELWVPGQEDNFEVVQGLLEKEAWQFVEAFGGLDNFYLEMQMNSIPQQHAINKHLLALSKRTGIKLIATCDSHYYNPKYWREREIYKLMARMQQGTKGNVASEDMLTSELIPKIIDELKCELYPKNQEQMWESYQKYCKDPNLGYTFYDDQTIIDAIERTHDIANNLIEEIQPDTKIKLPALNKLLTTKPMIDKLEQSLGDCKPIDEDSLAFEELVLLTKEGLIKKGKDKDPRYIKRAFEELDVVKFLKLAKYFLTCYRIINAVSKEQITGPGRGSGAASLIFYVIGTTQVDPIKYNLLFQRFLGKFKAGYPDLDMDVSNRDTAIKSIRNIFGDENVIPISNFNTLKLASLIKDLSRLQGIPFEEINQYTSKIEDETVAGAQNEFGAGFDRQVYVLTIEEAEKYSMSYKEIMRLYPVLEESLKILYGQIKSVSRHAGGLLIADQVTDNVPVIKSGGEIQTPWTEGLNYRHLEPLGFLKFDVLGLETLRAIEDTIRKILIRKYSISNPTFDDINKWYKEKLHPDVNSMDDVEVYKNVYDQGKTPFIFQFVENGVRHFTKLMKPRSITDLAIATSIFRPGPLCLSKNTKILVGKNEWKIKSCPESNVYRWKTIEQLYNEHQQQKHAWNYKNTICSYDEMKQKIINNNPVNISKSGYKEIFEIEIFTRYSDTFKKRVIPNVQATGEHQFLTLEGWKELQNIKSGEYLFFLNQRNLHNSLGKKRILTKNNIAGQKNFRNIAFRNYQYKCIFCDWSGGSLDVNHIENNRKKNNNPDNLCYMCPNHHRQYSENSISKEQVQFATKKLRLLLNEDVCMVRFSNCRSVGFEETYDISMEAQYHNFVAGGFIVHNCISADKLYLENRRNPRGIEYLHPLMESVLKDTAGLPIFQEQIQLLVHVLAGIPLDKTDGYRKSLMKKDISNKEKTERDRIELKKTFMKDCLNNNNIAEETSSKIFDMLLSFVSYSFNAAHATSYAINSYSCAWLFTYYPEEWLTTYIEHSSDKPDKKSKALSEIQSLGYSIIKPDINHSQHDWSIIEQEKGKARFVSSFTAIKGVGKAAIEEIKLNRPYKKVEDLLCDNTGAWHALNKRTLTALTKACAMDSMGLVGKEQMFKNYRQLHYVLVEKNDDLKKAFNKKRDNKKWEVLANIIKEAQLLEDWTVQEKIKFSTELLGSVDIDAIVNGDLQEFLEGKNIQSIDACTNSGIYWAVVTSVQIAKTSAGKLYLRLTLIGESNVETQCMCWEYKYGKENLNLEKYSIIIASFESNEYKGRTSLKTSVDKVRRIR